MRYAYRCARCHEWAFVSDTDRKVAAILETDALACPYCLSGRLTEVGEVRRDEVVRDEARTACDERCTEARGTICVCKCAAVNHGSGRTITVTRVLGKLTVLLANAARAAKRRPLIEAQIAEYEAKVATVSALDGSGAWSVKRLVHKAAGMHSHAGRMATLAKAEDAARREAERRVRYEAYRLSRLQAEGKATDRGDTPLTPPQPSPIAQYPAAIVAAVFDLPSLTVKQAAFIRNLIAERGTDADKSVDVDALTKDEASAYIGRLLAMPRPVAKAAAPVAPLANVPEGRYAITENGATVFYRVDKPVAPSRWAGYTFLSQVVGGRDRGIAVRDNARKATVMALIAQDSRAAMARFGQEIGVCGHCGRELTDEVSRKAGIGPVCDPAAWREAKDRMVAA